MKQVSSVQIAKFDQIQLLQRIFETFEKIKILVIWATEYVPDRENAPEIQLGENGFYSISGAQNDQNLDFFAFFETFEIQLHHTTEWANSEKLANLAHFEIWALIRDFRDFRKINNSHPGYAEISASQIKYLEIKKMFNIARKHPLGHQNLKYELHKP